MYVCLRCMVDDVVFSVDMLRLDDDRVVIDARCAVAEEHEMRVLLLYGFALLLLSLSNFDDLWRLARLLTRPAFLLFQLSIARGA